jgi:YegS/Rv2252/BmrU family lipid kinase
MAKKVLFVFNPQAGKGAIRGKLVDILDRFTKADYQVEIYVSQYPGDLRERVRVLGADKDIVICSGGDGTLNEVVSALMRMEKKPILGYLPTGTTNDFGASHKIPRDIVKATEIAAGDYYKPIDIGSFNEDQYFAYVAGFGSFTDIPYRTPQELKALLGHPAYIFEGAKSLMEMKPTHTWVTCEGETWEMDVLMALVSNANQVAGFKNLNGEDVGLDDGIFETLIIQNPENPIQLTEIVTSMIQGAECRFVRHIKSSEIEFRFEEPVEWVLDGEYGGSQTCVYIKNRQKSINFLKND